MSLRSGVRDAGLLDRFSRLLAHQGPDGEGFHRRERPALVHRSLSILEPEKGAPPISTGDGATHIPAEGEIYNYRSLQERIRGCGVWLGGNSGSAGPLTVPCYAVWHDIHIGGDRAVAPFLEPRRDPAGLKPR